MDGREVYPETLLANSVRDVLNLASLPVRAYSPKVSATPFAQSHRLSAGVVVGNPFRPDRGAVMECVGGRS